MMRRVLRWAGRWLLRLAVWLAAAVGIAYGTSRWYLPGVVQGELARRFPDAAISIEGARFSAMGVLVKGLAIGEDQSSLTDSPIFFAERVWIGFAPDKLLDRKAAVDAITIQDAVLTVEYERGKGWNVQRLGAFAVGTAIDTLPTVRLGRAALRVRRVEDDNVETIAAVSVGGWFAPAPQKGMYGFGFRADDRLALADSWVRGTLALGGAEGRHRLHLTGQVRMPRTRILGNIWNVDDVELECVFDTESVEVERLVFRMAEGVGTVTGCAAFSQDRAFETSVELKGFTITDEPTADAVVYSDSVLELLGPVASRFLRRFRPCGTGDVRLQIRGQWDHLRDAEVFGQVVCRDISVQDERFPYRLERLAGTIEFSGRSLTFDRLVGWHGPWEFALQGGIERFGPNAEIWLRVVSAQIEFDEDVYRPLGPEAKRQWFAFMPSGTGAIDYQYRRLAGGQRQRRLEVELIDVGVIYEHFPYPLEHLTGRVVFEPNAVVLSNVKAAYSDGRTVLINGTATGEDEFSIRIQAERIPIDERLTEAMSASKQAFLEEVEIDGGVVSAEIEVFGERSGKRPFGYCIQAEGVAERLVYAGFAVPLEEVRFEAKARPGAIEVERLTGRRGQGRLSLSGRVEMQGVQADAPGVCLEFQAVEFPLDEVFWAAAEAQVLPNMKVRPWGAVNASGRWSRNMSEDECIPMDIAVLCRSNPLWINGQEVGRVFGTVRMEKGRVRLEDFRIEQMELNESSAAVMPERMRQAYEQMALSGRIDVGIPTAQITLDNEGFGGMEAQGRLTLAEVKSQTSDFVEHLEGSVEGRLCLEADESIKQLDVFYQMEGFLLLGRRIDRLAGRLVFDPNEGVLASRHFSASVGQGVLNGSMTLDIRGGQSFLTYTVDAAFEGIEMERIVASEPASEQNEKAVHGKAQGTLSLQGRIGQGQTKQGQMNATVVGMRLGRQTLLGKVLTAIQFREPKEYVFDRMELLAFLRGDQVALERIRIVGKPFVFHGDGRLNLKSNQVAMDLVALGGLAGRESVILDSLLRGLGSAIWKIEIRGDIREPEIRTISLPLLQLPLELFRRS